MCLDVADAAAAPPAEAAASALLPSTPPGKQGGNTAQQATLEDPHSGGGSITSSAAASAVAHAASVSKLGETSPFELFELWRVLDWQAAAGQCGHGHSCRSAEGQRCGGLPPRVAYICCQGSPWLLWPASRTFTECQPPLQRSWSHLTSLGSSSPAVLSLSRA